MRYSVISWNVDRFFGSRGSPIAYALFNGEESSPAMEAEQVARKALTVAAAIDQVAQDSGPPLLVGLQEIENVDLADQVAAAVTSAPLVSVEHLCEDETGFALEGLDITLLVNTRAVTAVSRLWSHVTDRSFLTRDILECDMVVGAQQVSVLVNHWPSRLVSEAASQRVAAAHYVRGLVADKTRYSLYQMWAGEFDAVVVPSQETIKRKADVPVILMGDFNDEVFSESLEILGSTSDAEAVVKDLKVRGRVRAERFRSYMGSRPLLFNPFWGLLTGSGSYYRSPRWRFYDQILLSRGLLLPEAPLAYVPGSERIFAGPTVRLPDGSTTRLANRGGKPVPFEPGKDGCSDHFPVVVSVEL